jgi:choloylglycine hydrolase
MKISVFIVAVIIFLSYFNPSYACTDFRLKAKDGTILITRSMEFIVDLKSNMRNSNRGRQFTANLPGGKKGLEWKAKYGYLYLNGLDQDFVVDGMNEQGLAFEYLYLPGETEYQTAPIGKENQALPYYQFGAWVLGNFKTLDEVRDALANIYVIQATLPGLGNMVFPVHASIYDASGKGLVVEFVKGKMNIHDNEHGVLTNSPTFNWQVTNLRNYVNLSPFDPKPITMGGMTFSATGQGSGMVGLPGDVSPPSRFVKISFLTKVAYQASDATDVVNTGEHIINNVDIPKGLTRAIENGKELSESTQWVVFKDLTHKIFYYRTYNDMTLRAVSLSKIDFSENAPLFTMPLEDKPFMVEMTDKFLQKQKGAKLTRNVEEREGWDNIFNPVFLEQHDTSHNLG